MVIIVIINNLKNEKIPKRKRLRYWRKEGRPDKEFRNEVVK